MVTKPSQFPFLLVIIIFLGSCSPLKYWDKAVFKHYGEFPVLKQIPANSPLDVNLPLTAKDSSKAFVTGNSEVKNNLFLLLYWKRHAAFNVKLNDKIPLHQFSNSLYQYAKSSKVVEKLNGDKLIIDIEYWPNTFIYNVEEAAYLLLITTSKFYIEPKLQNVLVSYKIDRAGAIIKEGKVEIADPSRPIGIGVFESLNAAADDYLIKYDTFYKGLGKQVIEKILAEL